MAQSMEYSKISIILIILSVLASVATDLGSNPETLAPLLIASQADSGLQEVLSGQGWRLITPIFLHFGIMHLVFNMLWVWDLGKLIEYRIGMFFYVGFVLAVGVLSNMVQYLVDGSPWFGGMSGVVYGLFGYIWIRGRIDRSFGITINRTTVIMMLAWYVLCWTGLLGAIANWAHTAGLVAGAGWAGLEWATRTQK